MQPSWWPSYPQPFEGKKPCLCWGSKVLGTREHEVTLPTRSGVLGGSLAYKSSSQAQLGCFQKCLCPTLGDCASSGVRPIGIFKTPDDSNMPAGLGPTGLPEAQDPVGQEPSHQPLLVGARPKPPGLSGKGKAPPRPPAVHISEKGAPETPGGLLVESLSPLSRKLAGMKQAVSVLVMGAGSQIPGFQ